MNDSPGFLQPACAARGLVLEEDSEHQASVRRHPRYRRREPMSYAEELCGPYIVPCRLYKTHTPRNGASVVVDRENASVGGATRAPNGTRSQRSAVNEVHVTGSLGQLNRFRARRTGANHVCLRWWRLADSCASLNPSPQAHTCNQF